MNTESFRKPRLQSDGQIPPLTQLKLRSPEDRQWAFEISKSLPALEAIAQIKDQLGIDLRWESSYTRFLQWQNDQQRLDDVEDSLCQLQEMRAQGDPAAAIQDVRTLGMAVLLNESYQAKTVRAFAALNRQVLDERKLNLREKAIADRAAHNAQKLELAQRAQQENHAVALKKAQLVEKKLELEARQYQDAYAAAHPPASDPVSDEEAERRTSEILGIDYEEDLARRTRQAETEAQSHATTVAIRTETAPEPDQNPAETPTPKTPKQPSNNPQTTPQTSTQGSATSTASSTTNSTASSTTSCASLLCSACAAPICSDFPPTELQPEPDQNPAEAAQPAELP